MDAPTNGILHTFILHVTILLSPVCFPIAIVAFYFHVCWSISYRFTLVLDIPLYLLNVLTLTITERWISHYSHPHHHLIRASPAIFNKNKCTFITTNKRKTSSEPSDPSDHEDMQPLKSSQVRTAHEPRRYSEISIYMLTDTLVIVDIVIVIMPENKLIIICLVHMSLSLQGHRWSRFDAKARLPFKMAQGTVKGTIVPFYILLCQQ